MAYNIIGYGLFNLKRMIFPEALIYIYILLQMLPPGDWHCPNCTCKFCGIASGTIKKGDDATVYDLQTCKLCEKKCIYLFF